MFLVFGAEAGANWRKNEELEPIEKKEEPEPEPLEKNEEPEKMSGSPALNKTIMSPSIKYIVSH